MKYQTFKQLTELCQVVFPFNKKHTEIFLSFHNIIFGGTNQISNFLFECQGIKTIYTINSKIFNEIEMSHI